MASNENDDIITPENNDEEIEEEDKEEEAPKPEKTPETPEAKRARLKRQLNQHDKKFGFKDEEPAEKAEKPAPKTEKSGDFDYGEKAFLRSALDLKGADELQLAKNWRDRTGDDLDTLASDEIFLARLKSFREAKASTEAVPKGSKRSVQQSKDDVGYWQEKISSGEKSLTDIPDIALRRKVLNARIDQEKTKGQFSDSPLIMN